MLFQVTMVVNKPHDVDPDLFEELKATEKAQSQELQQQGIWRHLWRHAGLYANTSIFDVESNAHLHEILLNLPLYPFMEITITPLCRHPSSIRDDDS